MEIQSEQQCFAGVEEKEVRLNREIRQRWKNEEGFSVEELEWWNLRLQRAARK